jgi:hypothetical protein
VPAAERQGSRWLHAPPNEEEIKEWFEAQSLHPGMSHGPYMGGIVLIGATEKIKVSKQKQNGDTYVSEMERAVFTPYVKVDTRIAYFRDYVRSLNDGKDDTNKFYGIIELVEVPKTDDKASAYHNAHLPQGFTMLPVANKDKSVSRFLVCTARVAIYERQSDDVSDFLVLEGIGTKQVAIAKNWADDNAVMKAETGAVGRALGMAGILVVGTGVATAEDMQEAAAGPSGAAAATDAATAAELPADAPAAADAGGVPVAEAPAAEGMEEQSPEQQDGALRERATALLAEFEQYPEARAAYVEWWKGRDFGNLSELTGPALKGAVTKLERDLDTAKGSGPKDTGDPQP